MTDTTEVLLDAETLAPLFKRALEKFVHGERDHILSGVSEQNLCFRLALALEHEREAAGLADYAVDTEHNRNGGQLKTILDDQMHPISIRVDIILHSRGNVRVQDNLIAVEMKRLEHPAEEKERDRMRLRAMTKASYDNLWSADGVTLPEHVCGYVLGYYLELDRSKPAFAVEVFEKGNQTMTFEVAF
ncbi:hypothetical protein B7H23_07695 [Notoacmeibacter marinus]|uniref:Uncharacterized protein n=1 Tax=Notoacmeibacter marinus TaxID=1876515 RepID=A0A231V3N2_9HYPH|nr:hypothetical protein [Notoacmeibacter marinus]OXT02747.1 hypothetical protein B7H23_07695 [Notoacmeibacter marinus]